MLCSGIRHLTTDVLVIGGGVAGCFAGIGALEKGARVLVIEKAGIRRSGGCGAGNDHFGAHLNLGEHWDTDEAIDEWVARVGEVAVDMRVVSLVNTRRVQETVRRLEEMGVPMRNPKTGQYIRTTSIGGKGATVINFDGRNIKPLLAAKLHSLGGQVLNRTMATRLMVNGGHVVGATGIDVRDGTFMCVTARQIVLATGGSFRMFKNRTGLVFNTWHSPYNAMSGQVLAFKAGAQLTNMEFSGCNVVPKGFTTPGFSAFTGMGCYLINASGERYLARYHPKLEGAPRSVVITATLNEEKEGRGPCYFDCRHLSPKDLHHLTDDLLAIDKATFSDFLAQKGIDLAKQPLEIEVCEPGSSIVQESSPGVLIDERCRTKVSGLSAAGDCSAYGGSLPNATTTGLTAGEAVGKSFRDVQVEADLDQDELERERERVLAPLRRRKGVRWQDYEGELREIMSEHVGRVRTAPGIESGIKKLEALSERAGELAASNLHELMRCLEAQDLVLGSRLIARAALERKESRFGIYHFRQDYPQKDDNNWFGQILLERDGDSIRSSFKPLTPWIDAQEP